MKKQPADSRVTLYPDGKYRWVYEVPMLKNPSILVDVYKVLGISFGLVWLFNVLLIGCEEGLSLSSLWGFSSGFLILMAVFAVIGYVAYVIVAWTYGWKYVVLFEMDEKEVKHQQMSRQVKKAKVLGALTALAGAAGGRPGVVGSGILASTRRFRLRFPLPALYEGQEATTKRLIPTYFRCRGRSFPTIPGRGRKPWP